MSNTSASGGYLAPSSPLPAEDFDLANQFQAMVVGITGFAPDLVRPRWQPVPPAQPTRETTWCAIGVTDIDADTYPSLVHSAAGDGSSTSQRHETISVLASFYGPLCQGYASLLRDGLAIGQNREVLRSQGIAFVESGRMVHLGDLVSQQYIRRTDLPLTFRRQVDRTYAILNILSASGTIHSDTPAGNPITQEFQTEP